MATLPITKRGAEKLKAELHQLKTVERPWVINAISEARAQGDLSENAEYEVAKDRQGFIEGRIQEIEGKLSAAQIIDPTTFEPGGRVVFGSTVELEDEATGDSGDLPDRRRRRGRHQAGPGQHRLADCPRVDRQGRGRHRRSAGARRHPALRNRGRQLHLMHPPLRQRIGVLAAALWWGSLSALGFVVVPMLFMHLGSPAAAGAMAARLFSAQTWISTGCALLLLMVFKQKDGFAQAAPAQAAMKFIVAGMLLALLVEFGVAPRIVSARADGGNLGSGTAWAARCCWASGCAPGFTLWCLTARTDR